ncbi:alpha-1,6-mannosylglycoprotein 6-beta-N-acetylglucosaminyltransferase A-like [Porites lutea]|uniref:alpha-1,6-mannosylglycoprotein 6-beta-N-acetylglucosaminyltransferase A-like n=1 Tax=Porites lutea TaxID=51062 RepID=UPI003CC6151A
MTGDRANSNKARWKLPRLSSHRLGVILIVLSFVWGMYLIHVQINDRKSQSEFLKAKIIALSKEYIDAVAKEKGLTADSDVDNVEVHEMKKATAILLQNMLLRIKNLEKQVEFVIVNSTSEFEHLTRQIKYLNLTIRTVNKSKDGDFCVIPNDPTYPECQNKVKWMLKNWKSEPKFKEHGVNGSLCSILFYLSKVEQWCPMVIPKGTDEQEVCTIPSDSAFPNCGSKVKWMEQFWRSDPLYASHGVDGSLCSFLDYLSEVEHFCPLRLGRQRKDDCQIPNSKEYPDCPSKIAWMRQFWKSDPCYEKDHGVNGSICSFIVYLSEVERWCPLLPGKKLKIKVSPKLKEKPDLSRATGNVENLLDLLQADKPLKFEWIKRRIRAMWPRWQAAFSSLKKKRKLSNTVQKKILIHIGVLANEDKMHFAEEATKGGPLGELVQWSDLITSLYILGHDITVSADLTTMQRALGGAASVKKLCPQEMRGDLDLVYLDYIGLKQVTTKTGALLPQFKCKLRVVDSFGTEAQFNSDLYKENIPGGPMGMFGRHNLNLRQYQTMFPHSPDNTFLGFVVNAETPIKVSNRTRRKAKALVYGKHFNMWKDLRNKGFLEVINKYLEVHATVGGGTPGNVAQHLPSFVINHGVVTPAEVRKLLNESMVFVGIGFPYEGPAPLEAIASGCFFINPKFNPPKNRLNTVFFKGKPTLRLVTSQHPYCEEFIGAPHVYTVDVNVLSDVEKVVKEILLKEVDPYLPFEFTHEGMLERVSALVQNQDFCYQNLWPPLKALITAQGEAGKSCKEVCLSKGMVCEPEFFSKINSRDSLTQNGFPCNSSRLEEVPSLIAPGFRKESQACILQTQTLLFSCTGTSPSTMRLCPCRKYKKGQVALCEDC